MSATIYEDARWSDSFTDYSKEFGHPAQWAKSVGKEPKTWITQKPGYREADEYVAEWSYETGWRWKHLRCYR